MLGHVEGPLIGHIKTSVANLTTGKSCLHSPGQVTSSLHAISVQTRGGSSATFEDVGSRGGWAVETRFYHVS